MGKANTRDVQSKACEVCGQLYEQRRGEMPARFEARSYCSRACAGVAKRKVPPVKPCEVCGQLYSQGTRRLHQFVKSKYCSIKCAGASQQNNILDVLQRIEPDPVTGCHIWSGRKNWKGYGHTNLEGRSLQVHRAVWEHYKGPVPEGLHLDHICRNTSCCNIDHLRAVTPQVNVLAGEGPAARYARRENCDKCGGPFSQYPNGVRYCKPCRSAKVMEYQKWRRADKKLGGDGVKHAVATEHKTREAAEQRRVENTKNCLHCNATFTAAYGQWTAFERRKFCSPECAQEHSRLDHCPTCNTLYSTYPSGKRHCAPCRRMRQTQYQRQRRAANKAAMLAEKENS